MDLKDLKCMSIGNNCAGILCLGDCRVHGPVDNINVKNGKVGFELLFNGEFLKEFDTEPIITKKAHSFKTGSDTVYTYSHHQIVHNNPLEEKYRIELERRYNVFLDFYSHIKEPNYYFILSLSNEVSRTTHKMRNIKILEKEISLLKELDILHKTIFISTRNDSNPQSWWNFWSEDLDTYLKGCLHIQIEGLVGGTKITNEQFLKKFEDLKIS